MPGDMSGMGGVSTPADPDYGDSVTVAGTMSSKSDFDRRKKKRYICRRLIAVSVIIGILHRSIQGGQRIGGL